MAGLSTLKIMEVRMKKLNAECEAAAMGSNPERARHLAEELCQLTMLSEVLKAIESKTATKSHPDLESLRAKLETAVCRIIEMRWDNPERHEIANEIASLVMLAHSLNEQER